LQVVVQALLGLSLLVFGYLAIYLIPLYPLSILACIVLGLSLHSYVPLLIMAHTVYRVGKLMRTDSRARMVIISVFVLGLIVPVSFVWRWSAINNEVRELCLRYPLEDAPEVPQWVRIAQSIEPTPLATKYMKCGLVYATALEDNDNWGFPTRSYTEARKHDPLVVLATLFNHAPDIAQDDRIHVLESMQQSGHKTTERYWSDRELTTATVVTNARIWPAERLAYTEKTITVANKMHGGRWAQGEAIYTFHLPEGGIVTSLSLWINGIEQKGILTSRGRADSAYKQIVGVENRDPSIVHWQEGNTVTVRVFPVPGGDSRMFRVGFTAPLSYKAGMLHYNNVWFEGPDYADAREIRQIEWAGITTDPAMAGYKQNAAHRYECTLPYDEQWQLTIKDPGLKPANFNFDHYNYALEAYQKTQEPVAIGNVYLDINSAWTAAEAERILNMLKGKNVMVYDGLNMVPAKTTGVINLLLRHQFSLFPFHKTDTQGHSLVITKSTRYSPSVKLLKDSPFMTELAAAAPNMSAIKVFNLSDELSIYHRTLRERRMIQYEQGDIAQLEQMLQQGTFTENAENDSTVVLHDAGLKITRQQRFAANAGKNDHIMRLYAYNNIMYRLHHRLQIPDGEDTTLVADAEKAYVVTPVSSLVVLETQADYDRFGIKKSNKTLGDATLSSKGAVPEPHEWAMIILVAIMLLWALRTRKPAKG
jgi:XrtN system VIT domain protein